jgi:8-oxo-dGTP diphosphatase
MIECTFEQGHVADPGLRHVTVGVLVRRDGQLLLAKRAQHLLEGGKWGLPGGFLDRDETIQDGGRREVLEETGWEIGDMQLLRINDNPARPREDRQNVEFVYMADGTKQVGEPDDESSEVRWFDLDGLPERDMIAFDHGDTIDILKRHLSAPLQLPVLYNRT